MDTTETNQSRASTWLARLGWVPGVVLIGVLVWLVLTHVPEERKIATLLQQSRPLWLLAAAALQVVTYVATAEAIRAPLLVAGGHSPPRRSLLSLAVIKVTMDQILPTAGLSGTLLLLRRLRALGVPGPVVGATFVIEAVSFAWVYALAVLLAMAVLWAKGALSAWMAGTFEAACVGTLVLLGVDSVHALGATLLLRGYTFWLPMVVGVILYQRIRRQPPEPATSEAQRDSRTRRPRMPTLPTSNRPESAHGGSTLDLRGLVGLTEAEARTRLIDDGPNELPSQKRRGMFAIALEVVRQPMFIMLVAAGTLYLVMGEPSDAVVLLAWVAIVMTITIVQERRTERALDALRDLSSPRALVLRDGAHRRIAGREVVCGDLVVLAEGDRVPADALLRRGINLSTDESVLTGESVPVRKLPSTAAVKLDKPGGDDLPSVFSGTVVTAGQGIAEVLATGPRSELGKIGKALHQVGQESTRLQKDIGRLVKLFAIVGAATCVIVVVAYAFTRGGSVLDWKEGLLAGIAMAMALVPEEFPVVLTVFLALGAWRISRSHVLTRRMPAIEMLGATTVLCVDKTGTLTQNQMTLRRLGVDGRSVDLAGLTVLPEEVHGVLEHAILASKPDPFDPMERALRAAGDRLLGGTEHLHGDWSLVREYPLAPTLLAVSHAWRTDSGDLMVASKGAPEAIADLCHLGPAQRTSFSEHVAELASQGLRVLGVARGSARLTQLPEQHHDLTLELVGLLGFEDPLRPTVPAAVAECRAAGIRVVMITGDYPKTAQSIARQAGIADHLSTITGSELDRMSDDELTRRVSDVHVFARVVPEQKLRIVKALQANHEVVAMTGDGVNDAPALEAAHIGIAMGERGTDVARESASLVLLEDNFASVVAAVRLGRRIYDNIVKAVAFILAVHVPIAGLSMLPVFFAGWPLLLLPVHIAFLELIIDPACTLVFEGEEPESDVMRRPPRSPSARLFSVRTVAVSLLQGASVLAVCLAVFFLARRGHTPDTVRALTFATLVIASLMLITVNRSWTRSLLAMLKVRNTAFRWIVGGTLALLVVVLFVPFGQRLFHFAPVHATDLALCAAAAPVCLLWFEALKRFRLAPPYAG